MREINTCMLCPRMCKADRKIATGFCGAGGKIKIARAALHEWEEPCISGKMGSGTIFFSGCQLQCCYCQNHKISVGGYGLEISVERLAEIFLELQEKGAHNINLVSPTPYVPWIIEAVKNVGPMLKIPIVYNSGGYERLETLQMLRGIVGIYLPDLKYCDPLRAERYSGAGDYFKTATAAIVEMYRQTGKPVYDENGLLRKGLIIRHLVLPKGRQDSKKILDWIAQTFAADTVILSLMSQYTPCYKSVNFPEVNRRISTFEYDDVLSYAEKLHLIGYMQEKSSAKEEYTPPFCLDGVEKD